MTTPTMSFSEDRLVSVHVSWDCKSAERELGDILYPVTDSCLASLTQVYTENTGEIDLVYFGQDAEASPCVLRLQCAPHSSVLISSLLIVTEARTMEVYSGAGDYCGTCRGEQHHTHPNGSAAEGISLFKKYLKLETPLTSCDVKLLSLGGRDRVGVAAIVLGLQKDGTAGAPPAAGQGIDLSLVQTMVESTGTGLSPGAQKLMEMVQCQQKNQANGLSGFLPLLLGSGSLAAMAKACAESRIEMADARAHAETPSAGAEDPPGSASDRHDHKPTGAVLSSLNGLPGRRPVGFGPNLLPVLQGVCAQVTQLRIEDSSSATAASVQTGEERSCCRSLAERMERRMEKMEERLKQHVDRRLDALEQRLERALLAALPLAHAPLAHAPPAARGLPNGDA